MTKGYSAALPIAYVMIRILIVLNWLVGAAILALLLFSLANPEWTMTAIGVPHSAPSRPIVVGLQSVAALGVVAVLLNAALLARLLAMVETVRAGDPFVPRNAERLQAIAWILLVLQLLSLVIAAVGKIISTPEHSFHLDAGFSTSGWLAVILTFVLARVFAEGTLMREDLEGTI